MEFAIRIQNMNTAEEPIEGNHELDGYVYAGEYATHSLNT